MLVSGKHTAEILKKVASFQLFISQRENNDFQVNIYSIALITLNYMCTNYTTLNKLNYWEAINIG